ncbi:L-rhamnose mutarotase [Frondihabitans sucicola]|uniref:L-rhamnose mutarotase n=1 Tax=Frondihabitans sucicola TaxID=1268041 RepID=A0ABM8GM22_9MICO|nr:L-rhamnose mutarotase [Frondihabitans sucicola]BDZ49456.1 L-rhamnose mutarotase [Frondihabitans sucicola]
MTTQSCFLLRVRPDRLGPYLQDHQNVWSEMEEALRQAGWSNYSLFVDRATGLCVGTVETDDLEAAQARMAETEVDARWQAAMADYFEPVDDRVAPGESVVLERYFHLD